MRSLREFSGWEEVESAVVRAILRRMIAESEFRGAGEAIPAEVGGEPFGADEAKLEVEFRWGRWWAIWFRLEAPPEAPEHERIEVLRIRPDASDRRGFMLLGC